MHSNICYETGNSTGLDFNSGCGSGQPGLVLGNPVCSRGVETWWSLWSSSTQAILWFSDSMMWGPVISLSDQLGELSFQFSLLAHPSSRCLFLFQAWNNHSLHLWCTSHLWSNTQKNVSEQWFSAYPLKIPEFCELSFRRSLRSKKSKLPFPYENFW